MIREGIELDPARFGVISSPDRSLACGSVSASNTAAEVGMGTFEAWCRWNAATNKRSSLVLFGRSSVFPWRKNRLASEKVP
jgi:hypothetical protein